MSLNSFGLSTLDDPSCSTPSMMSNSTSPSFCLPDEAAYREPIRTYFQPYYAKGPDFGFWVAEEKATRQFIGWFHLRPAFDYRFAREAGFIVGDFDVGYRLVRAAWNKGYATELTRALVRRGFVW